MQCQMAVINVGNGHRWCEIQRDVYCSTAADTHSSCLAGYFPHPVGIHMQWLLYLYTFVPSLDVFAPLKHKMHRGTINAELSVLILVCGLLFSCAIRKSDSL